MPARLGRPIRLALGTLLALGGGALAVQSAYAAWLIWLGPLLVEDQLLYLTVSWRGRTWSSDTWQAKAVVAAPGVLGLVLIAGGATLLLARGRADARA